MFCSNFFLFFFFIHVAGEVVHADVLTLPNGKSKGCGIVEYSTPQEAQDAIEKLSNLTLNGRPIFVREDRESENKVAAANNNLGSAASSTPRPRFGGRSSGGNDPTQVYVSNIPFNVNWKNLKDLFKIAGAVIRCDIFQTQGRSKGTGVVLYETSADASNAISRLNGYEFHGRPLEVRLDKYFRPDAYRSRFGNSPRVNNGGRPGFNSNNASNGTPVKRSPFTDGVKGDGPVSDTIFVSNLPWATTNLDLYQLFQSVASVVEAEIQYEADGRSAGAGVVKFDTPASAENAVERLNGYTYGNRSLQISFATYPPVVAGAAIEGGAEAGAEGAASANEGVPTAPATATSAAPAAPAAAPASDAAEASPATAPAN